MSAYEKEREKDRPKQVELSSEDAKTNQEQAKSRVESQFNSDKKSPATKSASSDIDRRKFFQSLLQNKNGSKLEATVPNTIPEESESEANSPNSPTRGEMPANSEDFTCAVETSVRTDNIHRECNGNEDEKVDHVEEGSSKVEDSLSATGVSSEVRGAEVAEQSMDQKASLSSDKEPNSDPSEHQIETSNISENNAKVETETDEQINSGTLNTKLSTDQLENSDNLVAGQPAELLPENENKENMENVPSNEKINGETLENRTTNDSTLPEQAIENRASFKAGGDLLDEKDKPKDDDSSLTIALKSSYIGAPCEANEDAQSSVRSREEIVDPSESVAKNEGKSLSQSEENHLENQPNGESSTSADNKPIHSGSANNASQSGAESSPTSSPAATAGTSDGDSKSTFRAYVNIPEYLWSPIHQRLLGDLLFSIESDVQVWRR